MEHDNQILIGYKAISYFLGGLSENTIRDYMRIYPSMPIVKPKGQYGHVTAVRRELVAWWTALTRDRLDEYVAAPVVAVPPAAPASRVKRKKPQATAKKPAKTTKIRR
jgi:hypothetical protein